MWTTRVHTLIEEKRFFRINNNRRRTPTMAEFGLARASQSQGITFVEALKQLLD